MTVSKRAFLLWFWGGIAAFAISHYLHVPLITDGVPGGIAEHQSAPDAATVDAIQSSWHADGLMRQATIAMIADLIFIGIYGIGCVLAGLYFKARAKVVLRVMGWVALVSGAVFLVTDYGETISQFIQLTNFKGDDQLANLASSLGPTKILSWIGAFLAVIAAMIVERFSSTDA